MKKPHRSSQAAGVTRRQFVARAAAATSALAVASVVPPVLAQAARKSSATVCKETLLRIGEIVGQEKSGKLRGVVTITNGPKSLGGAMPMMRYFEGLDQQTGKSWPAGGDRTRCLPGPTLRARVGQRVEITFLNKVDVGKFPGGTLDNAETGTTTGCDQATNTTLVDAKGNKLPPDKNWYPGTRGDTFPNCFHGSSTANLHFHGTHVTPDGFGDNVLVHIRPDPNIQLKDVEPIFNEIFAHCDGPTPPWQETPWLEKYRKWQEAKVRDYDLHAIWKGVRGPVKDSSGRDVPALPPENQLALVNERNLHHGLWPQYFVGAFPNCFRITEKADHRMGQAPGTYWYHSHKHGSTSINLYNGLSGALIIEGDYDKQLEAIYPNLETGAEKVLMVQVFSALPPLELGATGGTATIMTNGTPVVKASGTTPQQAPTIAMRPGEIQLWRIVNAQVQNRITNAAFTGPAAAKLTTPVKFRQIAQDGVQFNWFNFTNQPLTTPAPTDPPDDKWATQFTLPAGGRVDLLIQAPALAAGQTEASYELSGVVNMVVCGDPMDDKWPTRDNYPTFPAWLGDIPEPRKKRTLSFDWEPYRINPVPARNADPTATPPVTPSHSKPIPPEGFWVEVGNPEVGIKKILIKENRAPYFMIDEEQFSEEKYYQTMILDSVEEWKILNTTIVPHPFHIHVNPFQVVESYDPNVDKQPRQWKENGVWQDVVVVPSALKQTAGDPYPGLLKVGPDGRVRPEDMGYVTIRSRFVDFTGSFVLHCHILGHEDRGMMQLVRVVTGATPLEHH